MKRVLYIVARHERKLYEKFQKAYAKADGVVVILDRRQRQRRRQLEVARDERRRTDRRWHDVSHKLRAIGWAMVREL